MGHLEEILKAADELETFINKRPPGAAPAALEKVVMLCIRMKGIDPYVTAKAGRIETLAAKYFSARKHNLHREDAFELRGEITHDLLKRIRDQVGFLREQQQGHASR
ncbi:MAG: hypothetical protein HGA47_09945 [Zoogloea sp.]|nr:hypothetical protein [Zoogloea sp.]